MWTRLRWVKLHILGGITVVQPHIIPALPGSLVSPYVMCLYSYTCPSWITGITLCYVLIQLYLSFVGGDIYIHVLNSVFIVWFQWYSLCWCLAWGNMAFCRRRHPTLASSSNVCSWARRMRWRPPSQSPTRWYQPYQPHKQTAYKCCPIPHTRTHNRQLWCHKTTGCTHVTDVDGVEYVEWAIVWWTDTLWVNDNNTRAYTPTPHLNQTHIDTHA